MSEISETIAEAVEKAEASRDTLNNWIAVLVAVFATFMALCNIKDGNIVQAMSQDQSKAVDQWSYYQAKGMKQNLAESVLAQLQIRRAEPGLAPQTVALLDKEIAVYTASAQKYVREKEEIKRAAEAAEKDYDRLNVHDDQFDMSDALISIAVSLAAVAALAETRWLLFTAWGFGGFGLLMGVAGFAGWAIHPNALASFLS